MSANDYSKERRALRRAQRAYDNMSEPLPDERIDCKNCGELFTPRFHDELCPSCDNKPIRKCVECKTYRPMKEFPSKIEPKVCKFCL